MSANLLLQYAVIALLVVVSFWTALRKVAPKTTSRMQAGVAAPLLRSQRGAFAQRVGRWLQPKGATGDCGDGCGTCGTCGPSDAPEEKAVTFHPPRK
ncbi:hypothetical protein F4827_001936 [Paraburkholderia bannensis]|uniref:Transmembrane protein n=1 Tax=Paraburkholderia bannensis TaxID=765414 RepID=A0A7W9WSU1_9BURK|nr:MULTISPECIES: DUF6587 family protein [Paraburkholderia]MBB3257134.1 hypothetical protein [Paraburkholderia sp. WP4_3_2]MBB6102088.1 hypothetical protein [Paraburkholderia bannensis]